MVMRNVDEVMLRLDGRWAMEKRKKERGVWSIYSSTYKMIGNTENIFLISGLGSNPVARVKGEFHVL